ncbi:MAG: sulfate reduction electron transfer complex DsrMKJOP subunit DsrJ [Terriglobia bacterium]|jgi:hypothetical protein|nr:sulfate reduction electron transfer complex DsrMKJOP subunit DsrJ [Terriglobia bacterium]
MRDRILISVGLLLFLALFSYPAWHAVFADTSTAGPKIELPQNEKTCVAPRETMRAAHQKLLIQWRENAVRNGDLTYTAYNGKKYHVGLSTNCMQCHHNKAQFCDSCHTYAGVSGPYCWDCHVAPTLTARRTP